MTNDEKLKCAERIIELLYDTDDPDIVKITTMKMLPILSQFEREVRVDELIRLECSPHEHLRDNIYSRLAALRKEKV